MTTDDPDSLPPLPHRPRGQALLAWIVILAVSGLVMYRHFQDPTPPLSTPTSVDANKPKLKQVLAGAVLFLTGLVGLCLLVVWLALVGTGKTWLRLHARPHHGAIYAETFALWMVVFVGMGEVLRLLPLGRWKLLASTIATIGTLAVVAWPMARGVRWQRVRYDLGLVPGRNGGLELVFGLGTYAVGLACAFAGALVTIALMALRKQLVPDAQDTMPTHPAGEIVMKGDWWVRFQVLIAASVVAPLLEETMFRGVLYRHLREFSYGWGKVLSIGFGTLVTSFVFAAIHPQGWLGIPPLMALATAFTLAREWRSTLLPSMLAHALNNTVVIAMTIVVFG